ncbi:MAG TPA: hypothetical protein VLL05_18025 [Terriglobales bacterium]|nr:hypothetical protein [Terriglobales bacterium]
MSINKSNDKNIPTDTEEYYETVAGQEEIYLEETEEDVRAILTFDDPSPSRNSGCILAVNGGEPKAGGEAERSMTDANNNPRIAESLNEDLNRAAEELITGDSDDSPLSEEAVVMMLRNDLNA